ncbi:DDE-type integrase/transposase/recombinase [Candidatus Phytoplasma fraxini]
MENNELQNSSNFNDNNIEIPFENLLKQQTIQINNSFHKKNMVEFHFDGTQPLYNREIIAYHMDEKINHQIIIKTLKFLPNFQKGCLFHSDQGSQYIAKAIQKALQVKNLIPSFSEKGQPAQNACIESFFSNLKAEFFYLEKKKI